MLEELEDEEGGASLFDLDNDAAWSSMSDSEESPYEYPFAEEEEEEEEERT